MLPILPRSPKPLCPPDCFSSQPEAAPVETATTCMFTDRHVSQTSASRFTLRPRRHTGVERGTRRRGALASRRNDFRVHTSRRGSNPTSKHGRAPSRAGLWLRAEGRRTRGGDASARGGETGRRGSGRGKERQINSKMQHGFALCTSPPVCPSIHLSVNNPSIRTCSRWQVAPTRWDRRWARG